MYRTELTVFLVAVFVAAGLCDDSDEAPRPLWCPSPTRSQLENVIGPIIEAGDTSETAVVELIDFHIVCRAFTRQQDRLRYVSVVVQYSCTGHVNCPSGTVTEQIEAACFGDEQWTLYDVETSYDNIRSTTTEANLTTTTRYDCVVCLSPELIQADSQFSTYITDHVTHCVGESTCTDI